MTQTDAGAGSLDVQSWWRGLRSSAVVGTGRRPPPPWPALGVPPRGDASPETLLLDAVGLAGALRAAGRDAAPGAVPDPPGADDLPEVTARAAQLLELLLTQPPVRSDLAPRLVGLWLERAGGRRLPAGLLPLVLTHASSRPELHAGARGVLGARGRWLASLNPAWDWVDRAGPATSEPPGQLDWARMPSDERVEAVATLRTTDPGAARDLVLSTWPSDTAKQRAAHLATLQIGLGPDDLDLLETALDDRAAGVRERAAALLDALGDSPRGERLGALLAPLFTSSRGILRRGLTLALPDPELLQRPAVVRDLGAPPPRHGSVRAWFLTRLVAGAPLRVLTDASGADPAATLRLLAEQPEVVAGLRIAVRARRDPVWATALVESGLDLALVPVVPLSQREPLRLRMLERARDDTALAAVVAAAASSPWGPEFSAAAIARLSRSGLSSAQLDLLLRRFPESLHPGAAAALESWSHRPGLAPSTARLLAELVQSLSLHHAIIEALS